ncbi:MAG: hypothetical protein ACLGH0_10795, partial [Thermoanaerobaculia bacterium]
MDAVHGERGEHDVVQRQDGRFGSAHGLALILLGGAIVFAPAATRLFGFTGFVAVYAAATLLWLPVMRRSLPLAFVLLIAVALRLPFFFQEPLLSGDVYRYLSDGAVFAKGGNPYVYTPTDPRINHPEIRSIYPPHAQFLFRVAHELRLWRFVLLLADIAVIVLLRHRGLAYATCPLVIVEGVWNGHVDLIAGAFLVVALLYRSGIATGMAVGLKISPVAAVPQLITRRNAVAFLATLLVPFVPFLGGPIMPGLRDYATRWIFNSPLYSATRALLELIPTKEIWTHHPLRFELISDFVYRHLYADFLTRGVLAIIAVAAILLARRVTTAVTALLLCSPAIHPWYWLAIIGTSLLERSPLLFFALAAPASYLLYDDVSPLLVFAI